MLSAFSTTRSLHEITDVSNAHIIDDDVTRRLTSHDTHHRVDRRVGVRKRKQVFLQRRQQLVKMDGR